MITTTPLSNAIFCFHWGADSRVYNIYNYCHTIQRPYDDCTYVSNPLCPNLV